MSSLLCKLIGHKYHWGKKSPSSAYLNNCTRCGEAWPTPLQAEDKDE